MPFIINNQTRPYDFGTDAIERQRVSLGQSVIDADFEYGLQATKWQVYQEVRKTPSFYEIPGTDLLVTDVQTNAATPSVITVFTTTPPVVGSVISITGLVNALKTGDRAEGFFLVTAVSAGTSFTYYAKGLVAANPSASIVTQYTVCRLGGVFNNGQAKIQIATSAGSVSQTGTTVTVTTTTTHGLLPGTPLTATAWTAVTGTLGSSTQGDYFIDSVPTATTFTFTSITSVTGTGTSTGGSMYVQPYSTTVHRPFDGGVLMAVNQPIYGSNIVRQSKKVFRYQSGKGFLWSTGTLFCPNNDIVSITASSTTLPATLTIVTDVANGAPQPGATVQIRGVTTAAFNGTYTVKTVTESTTLVVDAVVAPGVLTPVLGDQPRFIMSNWHGACVRAGTFEDQNGLFWEYDGQTLWVVRRSSTFQLIGLVTTNVNSQALVGDANTRFQDQLKVGDRITVRGMTHTVTGISAQNALTFNPPYRGAVNITRGVKSCKVKETRVPQADFNRDKINGTGPSGYSVDLTRMQMLGIQYTWYGAGFVDFMIRGVNGNWTMVHRMANNNVNDEAYMRTGNMPVRYEIANESNSAFSTLTNAMNSASIASISPFPIAGFSAAATQSANSFTQTLTGALYTGVYVADCSSFFAGQEPWRCFDKNNYGSVWSIATGTYTSGSGAYTGSISTTISGSAYLGEWVQIKLPVGIFLTSYEIFKLNDRSPKTFKLAGSNDGTTWTIVDTQTGITSWAVSTASLTFTPSAQSTAFTYYRLIVNATNGADLFLTIGELVLNGGTAIDTTLTLVDATTYWPTAGTVLIDQEMISYTGKTTNTLTGLGRAATLLYNIADTNKTFSGGVAATHAIGASVNLISCTCSPSLTHWGSAFIMDGQFDQDRGYFFNFQFNRNTTLTAGGTPTPLYFLRLSPSVSNGIIGDLGVRDLLNRAQLLLQKLDATSVGTGGTLNILGILNPAGFDATTFTWLPMNSVAQGGQPSFTQYSVAFSGGSYTTGSGERIFSMFNLGGTQSTIDLSSLKELSNTIIGGNRMYPDGPDTLMIAASALNTNITISSYNLYWTEAQA